jgi:hypothetical protein
LALIQKILTKLLKVYGGTASDELVIVWREALRDFGNDAIRVGADETLRRHRAFMPSPAEFRGYMEEAISRMSAPRSSHEDCEACRGTGWKMVQRADGQGEYATRCEG